MADACALYARVSVVVCSCPENFSNPYAPNMPEKVALIGSGNWGSAIATKMGINTAACHDFEDTVMMCARQS